MKILVSGGVKMGKSTLAQRLAVAQGESPRYIATMRPRDAEDDARVARHRSEREGWGFETVECDRDIGRLAGLFPPNTSLLLDSTTALLAEEMFGEGETPDFGASARVQEGLLRLLEAYEHIVIVSDTIHSDARRFDPVTEAYRRGLADIDRLLAIRCDAVVEMAFGQKFLHKGDERIARWLQTDDGRAGDGAGPLHGAAGVCPLG